MDHACLTAHMDWLFRLALRLCGSTEDAQELTQEALLSALQSAVSPDDPQAWLAAVLRRRHADLLRRKYRRPTVCIDCIPEMPAPADESADDAALAAQVRREVAFLAGKYREAFVRHYLHGERVAEVASAMEIPAGTVLSRLSTGREQIRKGLKHMEDYGAPSYQPQRLDVSCHGTPGLHDEPWSLVSDDLIRQNVLISAYDAPATPVEIARHMGVPTAYIEAAVAALVKGGLMRALPGGKVATDFLITTPAQQEQGVELQLRLVQQHYEAIMGPVRTMAGAVCASACYPRLKPSEQRMLREYFALHLLSTAIYTAAQRIVPAEEVFPDRPNGGRWIASGCRVPQDFDWNGSPFRRYTYGGERYARWAPYMDAASVTLLVYDVQPDLNRYQHGPIDMDDAALCRLLYILHSGLTLPDTGVDPALMQNIPHLTDCGVLRANGSMPECAVPVLTRTEHAALDAVRVEQQRILADALEPLLRGIFPLLRVPLPAHLTGRVAEFRRYGCYAVPMALREECIRRGEWTDSRPAPAMVLIVERD